MPYGVEGWPHFSRYRPLDHKLKEIRLLRFRPSERTLSWLDFSLIHHALGANPSSAGNNAYYALSYVWGTPHESRRIHVDGEPVEIRASLWRALWSLQDQLRRDPVTPSAYVSPSGARMEHFHLWVDFLCINQDNVDERNAQIQMMDQIFGAADGVFGWLGDLDTDLTEATTILTAALTADDFGSGRYEGERLLEINGAMSILMSCEYWQRIWIVQEFCLSRRFWLCMGSARMLWEDFNALWHKREHTSTILPARLDTSARRIAMTKARLITAMKTKGVRQVDMDELIHTFRNHKCHDPRDHIYGMLAIMQPSDRAKLQVDYRKPVFQVFVDACSLPQQPKDAHYFLCRLLDLLEGPGLREIQRQIREEGLSIPDVQVRGELVGVITDIRLRALVCGQGRSVQLHRPDIGSACHQGAHSFVYEYQADCCLHRGSANYASESRVSVSFASAKLQVGDIMIEIMNPLRGELVLRAVSGHGYRIVGRAVRHYLAELGTLTSAKDWLESKSILDPHRWHSALLPHESYHLVSMESVVADVRNTLKDPHSWRDTKTVFSLNCVALVNFLQDELWPHFGSEVSSETLEGWIRCHEADY